MKGGGSLSVDNQLWMCKSLTCAPIPFQKTYNVWMFKKSGLAFIRWPPTNAAILPDGARASEQHIERMCRAW
jgi:hypothetical protein